MNGQPTVILAKTIKGYGMGDGGEGLKNTAHSTKKLELSKPEVRELPRPFRHPDRGRRAGANLPFFKPSQTAPMPATCTSAAPSWAAFLPRRRARADEQLKAPALDAFKAVLEPSGEGREISTTHGLCAHPEPAAA